MSEDTAAAPGKGRGPFILPPLAEIKQANRVTAADLHPAVFKPSSNETGTRRSDLPQQSAASSSSLLTTKSSHIVRTGTDVAKSSADNGDSGRGETTRESLNTRKRRRDAEKDSAPEIFPVVAEVEDNERVIPQLEKGEHQALGTASSADSAGSSSTVGETAPTGPAASASGEAAGTSSAVPAIHHPHAIIANLVQKNNPVMKHIRNVPWELGDIIPDFVLGRTTCAMFLSIRYHSLHPNYIHSRLKQLGKQYQLRLLLVLVDMKECQKVLQELTKIAILADHTLMLAWSYEEAGRYLETYKTFENKPPDMLMERVDSDFSSRATESLTTVKKVNKTDAATLLDNFKTMEKVITASREDLILCPGLGPQKAQRLFTLFHQPFKKSKLDHLE